MRKIADILEAKKKCEADITAERRKSPSVRDRVKIRELQGKHRSLTNELSKAYDGDRVTPVDKSDKSEGPHREKVEEDRKKKVAEWEKKQNEAAKSSEKKD